MKREWTNVSEGLPDRLLKVKCQHIGSPGRCIGSQHYFFDPSDNTFRTPKWKNVTNKIFAWVPW